MSQLLALSFDAATSPTIVLASGEDLSGVADGGPTGWGFAWYPGEDRGAAIIKDPVRTGPTPMSQLLHDWERFRGTQFICHIRGAAKRSSQQDTQPFTRSYAGRDWIFAHNGDLDRDLKDKLPLGNDSIFEPVGRTDSEHAFCWLLSEIRRRSARRLAELDWTEVHGLLREIDALGTANLLVADGQDVVAYRDEEGFNDLYYLRSVPPHSDAVVSNEHLELRLDNALDDSRTMVMVSTTPLSGAQWTQILPGQMVVARRAAIQWISETREPMATTTVQPPAQFQSQSSLPPLAPLPTTPALESLSPQQAMPGPMLVNAQSAAVIGPAQSNLGQQSQSIQTSARQIPVAVAETSRVMRVSHETIYQYDTPVERSSHLFRLRPVHDLGQEVLDFEFSMQPNRVTRPFEDVFGNQTKQIEFDQSYNELRLSVTSRVRLHVPPPLSSPTRRTTIPLVWMPWQRQMMLPYLLPAELPETQLRELWDFSMSFVERQDYNLIDTLVDLNETIYRDFSYVSGSTTLETTPFDVYVNRRGVCQDFANLFICLARLMGVPARYRVGYIYTGGGYENKIQSDASHAWAEVYLPWLGWRGFDPTNGVTAGLDHIRVACGRNYRDATPTSGTIFRGGGTEKLTVNVRVEVDDEQ